VIRHSPSVTDKTLGQWNLLLSDVGAQPEDSLLEPRSVLGGTALRVHFDLYFSCQLNRFRHQR